MLAVELFDASHVFAENAMAEFYFTNTIPVASAGKKYSHLLVDNLCPRKVQPVFCPICGNQIMPLESRFCRFCAAPVPVLKDCNDQAVVQDSLFQLLPPDCDTTITSNDQVEVQNSLQPKRVRKRAVTAPPVTATHKGRSFEAEAEAWLFCQGYREIERNVKVRCSDDVKPYECDIHACRYSTYWSAMKYVAIVATAFCIYQGYMQNNYFWMVVYVPCILLLIRAKREASYHVWVECKNHQRKVTRDHVVKVVHATKLLTKYSYASWKPHRVLFFSATDYEKDALYFANQNRVECYRRVGDGFELVR